VAKLELPSSSADYLHNPKPLYPKLSERRGEQGSVILHVLVGVDGRVRELAVKSSSGFERLDQAARETVLEWTFVPGKRNGAAVEMAVDVPIRFKPSE
jgi:protein TonB